MDHISKSCFLFHPFLSDNFTTVTVWFHAVQCRVSQWPVCRHAQMRCGSWPVVSRGLTNSYDVRTMLFMLDQSFAPFKPIIFWPQSQVNQPKLFHNGTWLCYCLYQARQSMDFLNLHCIWVCFKVCVFNEIPFFLDVQSPSVVNTAVPKQYVPQNSSDVSGITRALPTYPMVQQERTWPWGTMLGNKTFHK